MLKNKHSEILLSMVDPDGEVMNEFRSSLHYNETLDSFGTTDTTLLIVNPGVMPELREAAKAMYANGNKFIYATSFTFGINSIWEKLVERIPDGRFRELLCRRLLPIPDNYLVRSAIILDILIFLIRKNLPKLRRALVILRNTTVQRTAIKLIDHNVKIILSHRTSSYYVFKSPRSSNAHKFLNYPIAHHVWCDKYCRIESIENPFWQSLLQGNRFTKREIKHMDKEIELSDRILVPSTFVKKTFLLEGVPYSKIILLPLGHSSEYQSDSFDDLSKIENPTRTQFDPLRVVFVGQLVQRKGLSYLLEGFNRANLPLGSSLKLVGLDTSGLAKSRIRNLPNVFALGHLSRSQIKEVLLQSDLFILPSLFEGFPLSAIDAMSLGIPVVVSDNTFAEDLIQHEVSGFIVKSRDSKEISDILEFAAANPQKIKDIGVIGMQIAQKYDWKSYQSNLNQLLLSN